MKNGETFEVQLEANNPGLWMAHCHNLGHASMEIIIEGIYRPEGENEQALRSDARYMRLISPELYGADVLNTIIYHQLKKIAQGKSVKSLADPAIRREYLYVADAVQDAVELSSNRIARIY